MRLSSCYLVEGDLHLLVDAHLVGSVCVGSGLEFCLRPTDVVGQLLQMALGGHGQRYCVADRLVET